MVIDDNYDYRSCRWCDATLRLFHGLWLDPMNSACCEPMVRHQPAVEDSPGTTDAATARLLPAHLASKRCSSPSPTNPTDETVRRSQKDLAGTTGKGGEA